MFDGCGGIVMIKQILKTQPDNTGLINYLNVTGSSVVVDYSGQALLLLNKQGKAIAVTYAKGPAGWIDLMQQVQRFGNRGTGANMVDYWNNLEM